MWVNHAYEATRIHSLREHSVTAATISRAIPSTVLPTTLADHRASHRQANFAYWPLCLDRHPTRAARGHRPLPRYHHWTTRTTSRPWLSTARCAWRVWIGL